jgi:hypothetical protein
MTSTSPPAAPLGNTPAFFAQAAISFAVASIAVGIGITYLPVDRWIRAFLAIGCLFLVSSAFTLAKCVRDHQEKANQLDQSRLRALLADWDDGHRQADRS